MVEYGPSKARTRVRFPVDAYFLHLFSTKSKIYFIEENVA